MLLRAHTTFDLFITISQVGHLLGYYEVYGGQVGLLLGNYEVYGVR